jgi:Ca-activated chloride channel family protein
LWNASHFTRGAALPGAVFSENPALSHAPVGGLPQNRAGPATSRRRFHQAFDPAVPPMSFLWPQHLWWMLALPLLVLLYLWLLRRRVKVTLRVSSIGTARAAQGRTFRRHVPPALLLLALALLLLALARPVGRVMLPGAKSTVLLALDVSLSMRVTDVKPTRMAAAQEAAKSFLQDLPRDIDVGVITFAGTAQVAQQPTRDRPSLVGAIDGIQMQRGTALGSAIVVCLAELFPGQGIDLADMVFGPQRRSLNPERQANAEAQAFTPVAPGSYKPAVIILLSDGRRTTGVDTLQAAQMAADRGVRVHVIGLGTPDGHLAAGEGMAFYLQLDEASLREVARMTGGEYHSAASAQALHKVYQELGSKVLLQTRETELTALLCLLAACLLVAGSGLSLKWYGHMA